MPRKARGGGKQKVAFEKHPPGFVPPKYKQMPLAHFLKPASMDASNSSSSSSGSGPTPPPSAGSEEN